MHSNDYIEINSGTVTTRSAGEGLECEKGYIEINGGNITIVTTDQKGHAVKSSDYATVTGGHLTAIVYGNASKALNVSGDLEISGGTLELYTAGDAIWDTDDTSSCAGIKCSGNASITGGDITIVSTGKGGKGINVDGTLLISGDVISVTTTGDQYVYDRNNDTAAKAIKSTGDLTITGGTITVRTSRTEAEGIESKATLHITGGDLDIRAYDDCLNASDHIQIDGGTIYCYSSTNDGIDSNGTLTVTGGTVISVGASAPEAGFDCDNSRFSVTGGILIGLGGDTSTPTASACTQPSVIYSNLSAFATFRLESTSGEILTFAAPRTFSRTVLLVSSPDMEQGGNYTLTTGGEITGGTGKYGLYSGAGYSGGTSESFTASSMVTTLGSSSMGPGRW